MSKTARILVPQGDFTPTNKPAVISPYDPIVQQAYNEIRHELPPIDVIKLEQMCPGDTAGYVSNVDYLEGEPGKKRIVHLCLSKIKNNFKDVFGEEHAIKNPLHNEKIKEVIKTQLKDVMRHEGVHIEQEEEGHGHFGPSAESEAERAEKPERMKMLLKEMEKDPAVFEMATMQRYASMLDIIASSLENKGLYKEAYDLDVISNTLEREADMYSNIRQTAQKLLQHWNTFKGTPDKFKQFLNQTINNYRLNPIQAKMLKDMLSQGGAPAY